MNPPPMPTLLELLTPLPPPPARVGYVRSPMCSICHVEPRAMLGNGKLDSYCSACRNIKSKKYYKKKPA